ncbi:electron transfer flavoprotein subunit alpha/FixB family protein [Treponema phagedenis]|uniref:Electron transfer flavoprotein subunit alpha n=1 Tax=Treponema phagedenis TaxID=162 RepID=A0A0B7GWC8_TREPH|nr:electron transfer flavoprotein subunit alpha/FixB family protein [Treponema phagedenis]EFW36455.1 electron transfer flavoprotein FAD-binding domain protein [Treponema phagedenis F0421]NVP24263.1 electron transfer flavoprotein subunit alpha/FixB family protein [Treponema phagedenis]QEJ94236.1 electron transfer flavoprotein subunit alpha/FixB family protein [Treponema phagedenis]QEJ99177.1 electron transfer flavoprotein subunit alpha/FixB family protein [Treponema phagedenis]QEK00195.1 electr
MNINDYKGILVFAEQRDGVLQNVGLELLGKAKELSESLGTAVSAILLGENIKGLASELVAFGADKVFVVDKKELKLYDTEAYTQALHAVITAEKPEIVLFGATTLGRDLAPRVSSRLRTGLTADCTKLEISEDKQFWMTRPAFGGNLMATIVSPDHRPQMSTVRPGVMKKLPKDESRKGEIVDFPVEIDHSKLKVEILEVVKEEGHKIDIADAHILVSGGRGVGPKANFKVLEDLAKEINAEVSSSRAQVDVGNMPHNRQVGQTGKTVRPDVYFACGISGAIQHLAGMEESDFIIAINKDKFAPIFSVADLGIVGDLHKVLPILTEEIKKYKASK